MKSFERWVNEMAGMVEDESYLQAGVHIEYACVERVNLDTSDRTPNISDIDDWSFWHNRMYVPHAK